MPSASGRSPTRSRHRARPGPAAGARAGAPRASGRHLLGAMLQPTPEAFERLDELQATGTVDLGPVRVTRRGRAGILELSNPRHLNAEDGVTLGPTESRGRPDPARSRRSRSGVFRGGRRSITALHRRARVRFGHQPHPPLPRADRLPVLPRARPGLRQQDLPRSPRRRARLEPPDEGTNEKLWIAAVERFAIGGACQLLHVVDHVIATRGSRLYLPARKEGIIPGASNLRLPRFVGDRAARQAILSGREWTAGEPDAALLCDEVVAVRRDGPRARGADRGAHQLGAGQRDREPAGDAGRARSRSTCSASTWRRTRGSRPAATSARPSSATWRPLECRTSAGI